MANLGSNVKTAFLKGLEALGKTASSLTDAAQQKLSEMNLDNRRREVLAEIPKRVMQLWKDGVEMPEPLTELLKELTDLEEKLAEMRPQPEAKPEEPEQPKEPAEEETAEEAAEEAAEEIVEEASACDCSAEDCCCEAAVPAAEAQEEE